MQPEEKSETRVLLLQDDTAKSRRDLSDRMHERAGKSPVSRVDGGGKSADRGARNGDEITRVDLCRLNDLRIEISRAKDELRIWSRR